MTWVTNTRLAAATVSLVANFVLVGDLRVVVHRRLVHRRLGLPRGRSDEQLVILDKLVGPTHGLIHLAEVLPDVVQVVLRLHRRPIGRLGRHRRLRRNRLVIVGRHRRLGRIRLVIGLVTGRVAGLVTRRGRMLPRGIG